MSIAVISDWKPIFDDKATGAKARSLRKSRNLKARAVANMMGMSRSHFSEIEYGKRGWDMAKVVRYEQAVEKLSMGASWADRLYDKEAAK